MTELEKMEKRWEELISRPKTKEEAEETLLLAKMIELEEAKEYQEMIDELAAVGIRITSVWDLVNTRERYPQAIAILLKYLSLVKNENNKEGIVRALTVREAKRVAVPVLLEEYYKIPKENDDLRWVIGNAINTTITKDQIELIFPIVLDPSNGKSRHEFIAALGRMKSDKVKEVLKQVIHDKNEITREKAEKALKKISK